MNVLIKQATVVQPSSKYHGKQVDILVQRGKITQIKTGIEAEGRVKTIESEHLHVSAGWVDIGTHSGEPGYEHRETLQTLTDAAAAGGYTHIAVMPSTDPVVDHRSAIKYLLAHQSPTTILPMASVSKGRAGEEITEMLDLYDAGAVAFTDGLRSLDKAGLLLRALQYLKRIDGILLHHAIDHSLSHGGHMHEGEISTTLGLVGIPSMAEHIGVSRDLELAIYAEAALTLHAISTRASAKAVRRAQKNNEEITATVSFANLVETDRALSTFDSNYKVTPPLRTELDRRALVKGLKNRSIKAIISNHRPLEQELKHLEFPYASAGMTGLEVCFAVLVDQLLGRELGLEDIIYGLSEGPRSIMHLPQPKIDVGESADLTLFDPAAEWTYHSPLSKSSNCPYLGKTLVGKPIAIVT